MICLKVGKEVVQKKGKEGERGGSSEEGGRKERREEEGERGR